MNANQTPYISSTWRVVVSVSNSMVASHFQEIRPKLASELDLRLVLVELVDNKAVNDGRKKRQQDDAKQHQRWIVNFKHLLLRVRLRARATVRATEIAQ
jgi:hypothetical protein